jgi:hypothetical protein
MLVCPACRLPWRYRSVRQEGRQVTRSRVSGDIAASYDHSHALGSERNFNESACFNGLRRAAQSTRPLRKNDGFANPC